MGRGETVNRHKLSFLGNGNVLKLCCFDHCTTLNLLKIIGKNFKHVSTYLFDIFQQHFTHKEMRLRAFVGFGPRVLFFFDPCHTFSCELTIVMCKSRKN